MSIAEGIPEGLICTKEGIYVLEHDTHLSRWIEEHGRLDIAEKQIDFYKHLIPEGGTVIDAGASLGDHAMTYAKLVGPKGTVLAFEPNPLAFKALRINLSGYPQVDAINEALFDQAGNGSLAIHPNAGASYISEMAPHREPVRLSVLDDFNLARLDFIHLDCEGCEHRAITGAWKSIKRCRPAMVIEINHACLKRYGLQESDMRALIDHIGYGWAELEPGHGPHLSQRDILATPK